MLKFVNGKWALVSKTTQRPLVYYKGSGKPSPEWVADQERRVQFFKHQNEQALTTVPQTPTPLKIKTSTGEYSFDVELADTEEKRSKGLMFRKSIPENFGMLFIHPTPQPASMWMKNTFMPLDILFILPNGSICKIVEHALPLSEMPIRSPVDVSAVLEINSGSVKKYSIQVGDFVLHPAIAAADKESLESVYKTPTNNTTVTGKMRTPVLVNPSIEMSSTSFINEQLRDKKVVFAFGRFNPVTVGHEMLVNKVKSLASQLGATAMVYPSHTVDAKKNPLPFPEKLSILRNAFGNIVRDGPRNIIDILKSLQSEGFNDVTLVVGSDRVSEFNRILGDYNGKEFAFKKYQVVSAGTRDPDENDVTGASASKMRLFASNGDLTKFRNGLPISLQSSALSIMKMVRSGMGLQEEFQGTVKLLNESQIPTLLESIFTLVIEPDNKE